VLGDRRLDRFFRNWVHRPMLSRESAALTSTDPS
jgi:hypothetical protein